MKGNSVQQTQRFETEQYRRPGIGFKERRGPVLAPPRGLRRLACLFSMMSSLALAQVSGTVPSPGAGSASPTDAYYHFLKYQASLDRLADDLDSQGKNGSALRTDFQQMLGFSDSDFALVRDAAVALQNELKGIDAKAADIVNAAQAVAPGAHVSHKRPQPPVLTNLQKQGESAIAAEIADLKGRLGPENAARMDAFLESELGPLVDPYSPYRVLNRNVPSGPALTQPPQPAPSPTPVRAPLFYTYRDLMDFQLRLDMIADDLAKQGKDASDLRTNYQHGMGLSDADFAVFRDTAVRLRDELKEIDERRAEIVQTRRALARAAAANRTTFRLPASPELIELGEQHDAVLVDEVAAMRTKLGPERTAQIDAFIERMHRRSQNGHVQLTPEQMEELRAARPHPKGDQ